MRAAGDPFRLRRLDVAKVVALGLGQVVALVAFLLLVRDVVNALTPSVVGPAQDALDRRSFVELGLLVVTVAAYALLRAAEFTVAEKVGYAVVRDLRMHMYEHLQGMTGRQLQHRARGGLLLRFIGDLSMLRMWISRGLLGGLVAVIVLASTIVVLAFLNPWLGLAITGVLAAGAAGSLSNGKRMRSATRSMRRRRSLVTGNIDEQINSLAVVQVFGRSRGEFSRLDRQNVVLTDSLNRVATLRGRLRGISSAAGLLAVVVVLAVGLLEVRQGNGSVGLVVAAILVTRQLNAPVRTLGLAHDYWHRSQVSEQKIRDFLASSSRGLEPEGSERIKVRRGRIEFDDVTVTGAVDGLSATADAGELVVVTGGAGAGKSTLLSLVARLVEPDAGAIVIDGQALAGTSPLSLTKYVGIVSADLPLMRGSVRRNLTYSDPDATDEEVERVVRTIGLDEILDGLPEGLDTWVTEGGRSLSGAQRQLISLGRAMLGNPPILLLDEPTAGLDPGRKDDFRRMLARHQGTVLLVSHEREDIAMADAVWVLGGGQLLDVLSSKDHDLARWSARLGKPRWPRSATS